MHDKPQRARMDGITADLGKLSLKGTGRLDAQGYLYAFVVPLVVYIDDVRTDEFCVVKAGRADPAKPGVKYFQPAKRLYDELQPLRAFSGMAGFPAPLRKETLADDAIEYYRNCDLFLYVGPADIGKESAARDVLGTPFGGAYSASEWNEFLFDGTREKFSVGPTEFVLVRRAIVETARLLFLRGGKSVLDILDVLDRVVCVPLKPGRYSVERIPGTPKLPIHWETPERAVVSKEKPAATPLAHKKRSSQAKKPAEPPPAHENRSSQAKKPAKPVSQRQLVSSAAARPDQPAAPRPDQPAAAVKKKPKSE